MSLRGWDQNRNGQRPDAPEAVEFFVGTIQFPGSLRGWPRKDDYFPVLYKPVVLHGFAALQELPVFATFAVS